MPSTTIAPAPWSLSGEGLISLYHFPSAFVKQWGFMEAYQQRGYKGGIGALIYMDYQFSNVGPYQELMFIPGLFYLGGKWTFSISKIWVSTPESLFNGQRNWGIPKELADFSKEKLADSRYSLIVSKNNHTFFSASVKAQKLTTPFWSQIIPLTRITQLAQHQLLLTKPKASGSIGLASIQNITADADFFPPLQHSKPLISFSVPNFQLHFPFARIIKHCP